MTTQSNKAIIWPRLLLPRHGSPTHFSSTQRHGARRFIRLLWSVLTWNIQSTTSREIRQRNEQFSSKARAGKNPINTSRKEKLAKQSPIGLWALGLILFVVVGGSESLVFLSSS